jgi:type I restriction enzyme R subunit
VKEFNPKVNDDNIESVITGLRGDLASEQSLLGKNHAAHSFLESGRLTRLQQPDKEPMKTNVKLVEYEHLERNSLIAANQVRFEQNGKVIRPDVTLFLNGFPIVQIELKSSGQGSSVKDAVRDLQSYEQSVPTAFQTALFNAAADTHTYAVGPIGAPARHYIPWNRAPPEYTTDSDIERFKQGSRATLNPTTLLNILRNYVFFEEGDGGLAKITPRYMQYYAAENLLDRVQSGDRTRGLIWHTQGSGKTFTMLFAADRLIEVEWFDSPQILLLVDTDDLREQTAETLRSIGYSHRFTVAESMKHLTELLRTGTSGLVVSTIQMFEDVPTDVQGNENTVILSDEAHRMMEKRLGNRLDGAVPDAHHYGFTGTPVSENVRNTFRNYESGEQGNGGRPYLDRYSIKQGIEDGVILPVHFEVRTDVGWRVDDIQMDEEFQDLTEDLSDEHKREIIQDALTTSQLSELPSRVDALTKDIYRHYQDKLAPNAWKALVVVPSRQAAVQYGDALRELHDEPDDIRVVISQDPDDELDSDAVVPGDQQKNVIKAFKREDSPKLLVVCDMLLTGFDAEVLKCMYLDRNLKDHNLLQAIARVNRPSNDGTKNNGLIVDYRGALANLEDALAFDDDVIKEEIVAEESELLERFEELLEECKGMFSSDLEVQHQEDITALVTEIAHRSERFKEQMARLQNVYESLSPHGGLIEYESEYRLLNQIRLELESVENTSDGPVDTTDEWGQKTLALIEENIDISTVGEKYPEFTLDTGALEEIRDVPPEIDVIRVGKGLQEILERERHGNPRYEQLSERLKTVLEQWRNDINDATETLSALERIEEHTRELEERRGSPDLNDAEYAIYLSLLDEREDKVRGEDEAKLIAKEIEEQFLENVNRDFLGWKTNPDTQKEIRTAVITALQEVKRLDLYREEGFVDVCIQYLIENHN